MEIRVLRYFIEIARKNNMSRAEDILAMVDKTTDEFRELDNITGGEVHIGCAESHQIRLIQLIKVYGRKNSI